MECSQPETVYAVALVHTAATAVPAHPFAVSQETLTLKLDEDRLVSEFTT
jgi:hypothetical protein